jgi:hypothetical protein
MPQVGWYQRDVGAQIERASSAFASLTPFSAVWAREECQVTFGINQKGYAKIKDMVPK